MFVSQMSFFAKISDPAVGGTYMTLVNTLANMGGNWPTTLALYLVEGFTLKQCSTDTTNSCSNHDLITVRGSRLLFGLLAIFCLLPLVFFGTWSCPSLEASY